MPVILMKQLLEAGVHFGHQTRRWNPKMSEYIFTERNSIHIIDLQKTVKKVDEAYDAMRELAEKGDILFVGTKKQAQDSIKEEAQRCGQFYVNYRWLGGTLTNFVTIKKRVARLEELRRMEADGSFELRTKKEVAKLKLEMTKLDQNLGGIVGMVKLPAALFIVDTKKEHNAVAEAKRLGIPIVAIVDTNCDPVSVQLSSSQLRWLTLLSKLIRVRMLHLRVWILILLKHRLLQLKLLKSRLLRKQARSPSKRSLLSLNSNLN